MMVTILLRCLEESSGSYIQKKSSKFYIIGENFTILCVDTILHALQFTHAVMFTKNLRIMPSRISIRRTDGRCLQVGKRIFALIVLRTICKNCELLRSSFAGVKSRRFF